VSQSTEVNIWDAPIAEGELTHSRSPPPGHPEYQVQQISNSEYQNRLEPLYHPLRLRRIRVPHALKDSGGDRVVEKLF
jgi:hypothetical protein